MIKSVSKVLYSNKEDKALMRKECERAVQTGGYYSIDNVYMESWYTIYTIYYNKVDINE